MYVEENSRVKEKERDGAGYVSSFVSYFSHLTAFYNVIKKMFLLTSF